MKKIFAIVAVTLACASCLDGGYFDQTYTGMFGFNYRCDTDVFTDSVYFKMPFADYQSTFLGFYNVCEDDVFRGGIAISLKRDSSLVVKADNPQPNLTVYPNPTSRELGSIIDGCAIFYDGIQKPQKHIQFLQPEGVTGTCTMVSCMVTNVQPVVKHFLEEGSTAIENGDFIKLKATGLLNGKETGTATYVLASADSVNVRWRPMNLEKLGQVDEIKLEIETSGNDIPKYCAFDNITASIHLTR